MGCNCRKPRPPRVRRPAQPLPKSSSDSSEDKPKGRTESFTLRTDSGTTLTFATALERNAAAARMNRQRR